MCIPLDECVCEWMRTDEGAYVNWCSSLFVQYVKQIYSRAINSNPVKYVFIYMEHFCILGATTEGRNAKWMETLSCTVARKRHINLSHVVISLHVAVGLTAKQKEHLKKQNESKCEMSLPVISCYYQLWFEQQDPFPSLFLFAASDFSSLAQRCLGWPPGETLRPWSHFGVSLRPVKAMAVQAIWSSYVSHVPCDMHVFNYSPLAWHSPASNVACYWILLLWFDSKVWWLQPWGFSLCTCSHLNMHRDRHEGLKWW